MKTKTTRFSLTVPNPDPMVKNAMKEKQYRFTVLFEPSEEGGYVATCPALPGLVTEGDTLQEARRMAKEAIRCYLESLLKDGQPVPADVRLRRAPIKEKVDVVLGSQ